jgi:ribose transport system substrate-binding protein
MKKLIAAAALLGAATALSATAHADSPYYAIIAKGFDHQFWQAVKKGAEDQAKADGVTITFEGPKTEAEIDKQIDILNADFAKKPVGLGFAALDTKAETKALQQYADAKIPIVAFDSGVANDLPVTTCTTDNEAAAAEAAKQLAKAIGDEGEVADEIHDQTSATGLGRRKGFEEEIAKHPKIKLVDTRFANADAKAADDIKAILTAHPNLKGIFASNEGAANGLAIAKKETGSKVIGIGFDSGKKQKDAINSGLLAGAITQNPVGIGQCAVSSLTKVLKGEKLPKTIDTGFYYYTKDNMNDPKIAAVLYD